MKTAWLVAIAALLFPCLSAAQEAHIYDTVAKGTYVYDAASSGKLTLVKGSPFQTVGSLIGTNGKFFLTLAAPRSSSTNGSGYVFTYAVEPNGGIGKQVGVINTQLYGGSGCAYQTSAELDHTGSFVYVLIDGGYSGDGGTCAAVQTYEISSKGELTFKGASSSDVGIELPKVTGNNKFGYSVHFAGDTDDQNETVGFTRESSGTLQGLSFGAYGPVPPTDYSYFWTGPITPDPTNHLAAIVDECGLPENCQHFTSELPQLASFTVDSHGNLESTNTYADMPTVDESVSSIVLDPTGKTLAVAIDTGVQFFHFNGAKPITPFTGIVGVSGSIIGMAWDKVGHLYAQNGASGKMHVYEITTKGATELSGSGTVIPKGTFVVRSK